MSWHLTNPTPPSLKLKPYTSLNVNAASLLLHLQFLPPLSRNISPFSFSFMNELLRILLCKRKKNSSQLKNPELSYITADQSWSFSRRVQISMDEISKATNNFSLDLIIDTCNFGLVYKAQLSNCLVVAIKKFSPSPVPGTLQGFREFSAEVETLGKLRHRNIVKLLGSCARGPERLLVYEFIERGSLDLWLHHPASKVNDDVSNPQFPLPWETSVKIIRGVANGLCYLHGLEKPIIHRDITACNVLLDSEFEAHISDFGLARIIAPSQSNISSQYNGSMGYMPPEYTVGGNVATFSVDVYSFGVLMLETATGHQPNLPVILDSKKLELVVWAGKIVAQNGEMEMVDPNITRDGRVSEGSAKEYFRIALKCTSQSPKDRPEMAKIVEWLDRITA